MSFRLGSRLLWIDFFYIPAHLQHPEVLTQVLGMLSVTAGRCLKHLVWEDY